MAGERAESTFWNDEGVQLPSLQDFDSFSELLRKLSRYIADAVCTPRTFDELGLSVEGHQLSLLIEHLAETVHNRSIVCAILALKMHFNALESDDNRGVNITRGLACEYVAWRFLTHLSGRELINFLLYELPPSSYEDNESADEESATSTQRPAVPSRQNTDGSRVSLLSSPRLERAEGMMVTDNGNAPGKDAQFQQQDDDFASLFDNLNALEVAAVVDAKKFMSQRVVQRMIESIWRGEIVFWETLSVNSIKKAKIYDKRKADPYCRLRVPRYLKIFEALYFISFLIVYLAVLIPVQRNAHNRPSRPGVPPLVLNDDVGSYVTPIQSFRHIMPAEVLLYIWIAGFAYDEFGEYRDAGQYFYAADFWSLWDIGIIAIGLAFFVTRIVGLSKGSDEIMGAAFDILALEALFLVPRLCSILSLNPYFGTLIPSLREMTKDFIKFLSLVVILYLGFLTTFTLLARDNFSLREMSWILVKVFFGSSYLGFDVARDISPVLGPPLMLIFVCLTNILLITSLISLLSNSLTRILDHAREEYLFIYSVYVLEASTSNRLTYYLPPLNLIPLLLRPLRLFVSTEQNRKARILLLKITHAPYVAAIWSYEFVQDYFNGTNRFPGSGVASLGGPSDTLSSNPKRTSYLRSFTTPRIVATNLSQASLPRPGRESHAGKSSRPATAATGFSVDPQDDLRSLVLKLSAQVEELTAIVAEQHLHSVDTHD